MISLEKDGIKVTPDKLDYLLRYHHSLSIQYASFKNHGNEFFGRLNKVEKEIEILLELNSK